MAASMVGGLFGIVIKLSRCAPLAAKLILNVIKNNKQCGQLREPKGLMKPKRSRVDAKLGCRPLKNDASVSEPMIGHPQKRKVGNE